MLQVLKVFNFALIEQAEIDFSDGFNVLTGETGAGKSIVIDAIGVVLGGRSSVEMIRGGCEQYRIEAVFDVRRHAAVLAILADQALPLEEDGLLFISRTFSRQGKNTVLLNGAHTPLSLLRTLGDLLLDMHGQHENQALLRSDSHSDLLDASDARISQALACYQEIYGRWRRTKERIVSVDQGERQRKQRADMLRWQAQEIQAAKLREAEEEELAREISLLTHAEKISASVGNAWSLLSDGGRQGKSVSDMLQECRRNLESALKYDSSLSEQARQLHEMAIQIEDVAPSLRDYLDRIEFDPGRLAKAQDRMDLIYRLKQKYGSSIAEIITYGKNAQGELEDIERHDEVLLALQQQLIREEKNLLEEAEALTALRLQAAEAMGHAVESHLKDLGMPGARFSIVVTEAGHYSLLGRDSVSFEFSANQGEELRPLAKVASGGELSRVALAIKTVSAGKIGAPVMIFDEIDSGVGGHTARKVAEKIGQVAGRKQVLCITHLPQIAAMADHHVHIEKRVVGQRSQTFIKILSEQDRLKELARMTGGEPITKAGLENAAEMVRASTDWKYKVSKTNSTLGESE